MTEFVFYYLLLPLTEFLFFAIDYPQIEETHFHEIRVHVPGDCLRLVVFPVVPDITADHQEGPPLDRVLLAVVL